MTMGDLAKPRKTYVLNRGHYASPIKDEDFSERTQGATILPEDALQKRLSLAKWLTDDDHR